MKAARWFESLGIPGWKGRIGGLLFCGAFLVGGLGIFFFTVLHPFSGWLRARSWVGVPATIEKAELAVTSGGEGGPTYKVAVQYRYSFANQSHQGSKFDFTAGSTNIGVEAMRRKARFLSSHRDAVAWVNPANPAEAVLDRSLPGDLLLGCFFCVPFLLVGVTGITGVLFGSQLDDWYRSSRSALLHRLLDSGQLRWRTALPEDVWQAQNTAIIFARDERLKAALATSAGCLFVNGIVGVFVIVLITEWRSSGHPPVVLLLFLIPFEAIGVAILWTCLRAWKSVARPNWIALLSPLPGRDAREVQVAFAPLRQTLVNRELPQSFRLVAVQEKIDTESRKPNLTFARILGRRRRSFAAGNNPPRAFWKSSNIGNEVAAVSFSLDQYSGPLRVSAPPFPYAPGQTDTWSHAWYFEAEDARGVVESHLVCRLGS